MEFFNSLYMTQCPKEFVLMIQINFAIFAVNISSRNKFLTSTNLLKVLLWLLWKENASKSNIRIRIGFQIMFVNFVLRKWDKGIVKNMPFNVSMIWREPRSDEECYSCLCNLIGYFNENKNSIKYPEVYHQLRNLSLSQVLTFFQFL